MDAFQELREFWGNSLVTLSLEELKPYPFSEETRDVLTNLGLPVKKHSLLSWCQMFFFHDRFQSLMFNGREFVSIGYMTMESCPVCIEPATDRLFILYDVDRGEPSAVRFLNSNLLTFLRFLREDVELELDSVEDFFAFRDRWKRMDPAVFEDPESFWYLTVEDIGFEWDVYEDEEEDFED